MTFAADTFLSSFLDRVSNLLAYFLTFDRPLWLLLVALIVPVVYLWRTSKVPASKSRRAWSLGLRVVLLMALVLALAGARLVHKNTGVCVVFLLDQSNSVPPEARAAMRQLMQDQIEKVTRNDQFCVVEFGADAVLDNLPSPKGALPTSAKVTDPGHTDIARALRLAMASFPADRQKRVILFSDGNQNGGDALREARIAAAKDIDINVMLLAAKVGHEVMLDQLVLPPRVNKDARFAVRAIISSDQAVPATLLVSRDGNPMPSQRVQLKPGSNVFDIQDALADGGFHEYAVTVTPDGARNDTFAENNRAFGFTQVDAPGKVLVVHGSLGDNGRDYLSDALRENKLSVDAGDAGALPASLQGLMKYDCVVLQNVNGKVPAMTPGQQAALAQYVRDFGGGLVLIGGDESFGPGGYKNTPIEEIAPVEMDVKRKKHLASLALAVTVDKSGSMGASAGGGLLKMDLANQGAAETIKLLDATDEANVSMVDTEVKWVHGSGDTLYRMDPAAKRDVIANTLANRTGGGGIYCMTALDHAYRAVRKSSAMTKHVIMFADAADSEQQEDCVSTAAEMYKKYGITTSVIGLGTKGDSDYQFQVDLAKAGKGRHYLTNSAMDLPKFFAKEAFIASRNAFVEEPKGFYLKTYQSPLWQGLDQGLPKLYGYVGATAKPRATLAAHGIEADDPVLAHWVIGLGKSVAFTSDANNRWSKDWVAWSGYSKFWAQTVRWASRTVNNSSLSTTTTVDGSTGRTVVEALDPDGKPINNLQLKATIAPPDQSRATTEATLTQVAPGRYETTFPVKDKGTYIINVVDRPSNTPLDVSGATLSYPAEFRDLTPNAALLKALAETTGGQYLESLDAAFQPKPRPVSTFLPLWEYLLFFAAVALFVDIAQRRLNIADYFRRRSPAPRLATATGDALGAFRSIKSGRSQVEEQRDTLREKIRNAPLGSTPPPADAPAIAGAALAGLQAPDRPTPSAGPAPTTPAESAGYTNRLLHAKRRAADQIQDKEKK